MLKITKFQPKIPEAAKGQIKETKVKHKAKSQLKYKNIKNLAKI